MGRIKQSRESCGTLINRENDASLNRRRNEHETEVGIPRTDRQYPCIMYLLL